MRFIDGRRRIAIWSAALAVFLASIAPAWTHLLASLIGDGTEWIEVCTTQGTKWVAATSDATPALPDDGSAASSKHCPLCLFHANLAWLPPADFIGPAVDSGRFEAHRSSLHSPARATWPGARSRAPPLTT